MSPVTRECCPSGYVTTCRTTYGGQTVWQVVTALSKRRRRLLGQGQLCGQSGQTKQGAFWIATVPQLVGGALGVTIVCTG
jgi:hypothetical protein